MSSRPSHSCPFVVPKHRLLFVPFGVFRGPTPPTTSPLRFIRENPCSSVARKTPLIRLIRGLEPRLPRGPSPLTPGPSPLSGARGAMWGCRGDLVLKPELHWHATHPCPAAVPIRVHSSSFVVQKPPPFVVQEPSPFVPIGVHSWFKNRLHPWRKEPPHSWFSSHRITAAAVAGFVASGTLCTSQTRIRAETSGS